METEVFVYGKLALAFSARCFTARHYDLNKDDCQFKCMEHPEGITLKTREGQPFLTINGIQTMSAQSYNLLNEVPDMLKMGIDIIRISPQPQHMSEIIAAFDAARRGETPIRIPARGVPKDWWTDTGSAMRALCSITWPENTNSRSANNEYPEIQVARDWSHASAAVCRNGRTP